MIRNMPAFRVWLTVCGGEVLPVSSDTEVLRVRTYAGTMVVQRNARNRQHWPDGLVALAKLFNDGEFPSLGRAAPNPTRNSLLGQCYSAIIRRDGQECFYCGRKVPAPGQVPDQHPDSPTVEHLVSRSHGGPNHMANLFLAHFFCNQAAGNLAVPAKLKLRDTMRAGK